MTHSPEFQMEPFEPNKHKELAVFKIGDDYWFMGYDIESCLKEAVENYEVEATEHDCFQLDEEDLQRITFHDEESGDTRTFEEQFIIEKTANTGPYPRFFASENW